MNWIGRSLVMGVIALASVQPVSAQIYAWRDAHGTLVLSNRATDPTAITYAVPRAGDVRSTRPATGPRHSEDIDRHIVEQAETHSLRPDLVRAVIQVESAFNARALSPKGAMGLMQLMPAVAVEYDVQNPYDPAQNIRGGVAYLRRLLDRYEGNEELALAAYNAGPGAVDRYGRRVPPYQETRQYVRRIRAVAPLATMAPRARVTIYKQVLEVEGRRVPSYSTEKPAGGEYEIVSAR